MVRGLGHRVVRLFTRRDVMAVVAGINLVSFALGILWYWDHLARTRVWLWPVVPDCPLAALFVAAALFLRLRGRASRWMDALAWAAAIKYGIWTIAILAHARLMGATMGPLDALLFWSHVGLLAEGLLYGYVFHPGSRPLLLPGAWFVVNDFFDYVVGTHPALPLAGQWLFARNLAIGTSIIALATILVFARRNVFQEGNDSMQEATLSVPKMVCAGCHQAVTGALQSLDGVEAVKVDAEARRVRVSFDPGRTRVEALVQAVVDAGYDARAE